ncbi:unnamed protein product [Ixodes pacificus]
MRCRRFLRTFEYQRGQGRDPKEGSRSKTHGSGTRSGFVPRAQRLTPKGVIQPEVRGIKEKNTHTHTHSHKHDSSH